MMKLITTLLTSILLLSTVELAAQDTDALSERIDLQRYEFPQEKIHVMTDRGNYLAGDTIWLRAWVVDAATHHKVDASQFVYVTLVSPTDSVQNLVKIHCNADGVFEGYLPLDIDIPEGRYQLSAYTMFMQSIGAEYFYSQPIEASQVVTGRVLSDWRKKPVAGANVSLIAPRVEFSTTAVTDSLGEFAIALPLLPDSVDCIVMAENIKGKKQMNLELDKEVFPQVYHVTSNGDSPTTPATIIDEQQWRLEKGGDWRHIILNELLVTARRPRLHSNERNPYSLTSSKIAKMDIRSLDAAARALPGLVTLNGELYTAGGTAKDRVYIIVDGEPVNKNFTSDDEALKMLEESTRVFPQDPIYREPDSSIFWPSGLGEENHYDLPEMSIAESMVSFKDLDYIYFARKPHGGGTLIIQHKEGYHANGRKEPSVYLKITQPMGAQRPAEFYSPRYDDSNSGFEPGTDLRTTLYWNPCVAVDAQGKSTFDFYASDAHSTRYLITVEGITSDGTPFRATHEMTKR